MRMNARMNSCGCGEGPIENAFLQGPEFCATPLLLLSLVLSGAQSLPSLFLFSSFLSLPLLFLLNVSLWFVVMCREWRSDRQETKKAALQLTHTGQGHVSDSHTHDSLCFEETL